MSGTTANCLFYILVHCSSNTVWLLHTLKRICTVYFGRLWRVFKGHKKSSFPLECQSVTALFCSLLTQLVGLVVYQCWNSSIPTCTHLYWIRSFDSLQPSQQIQKCIQHIFLLALKARKHIRKNQVVLELKNQRF